jgi:hypothetical protein
VNLYSLDLRAKLSSLVLTEREETKTRYIALWHYNHVTWVQFPAWTIKFSKNKSPSHPFGVTKPSSSNSATSGKTYTSMSSEVAFSTELDSATFWDKGTVVPSLSQDKETMGQAKILQNPGRDAEQNGTEQKRMLEYIKKMF